MPQEARGRAGYTAEVKVINWPKGCEESQAWYVFLSGDAVDILFELSGSRYAVVELETWNPLPGCHQALKYRVPKCAETGLKISSSAVEAIVVAYNTNDESMRFRSKYGIKFVKEEMNIHHSR